MTSVISWLEAIVSTITLPFLEVWSRFSYRRSGVGCLRLRPLFGVDPGVPAGSTFWFEPPAESA